MNKKYLVKLFYMFIRQEEDKPSQQTYLPLKINEEALSKLLIILEHNTDKHWFNYTNEEKEQKYINLNHIANVSIEEI
jgi:hypothetical protein